MATRRLPPLDYLRQCFDYNPETGVFIWLERPAWMFTSERIARATNTKRAGRQAFVTIDKTGRNVTGLCGQSVFAHRVAIYMGTGVHPDEEVDHINGDPRDNRLVNLRPVSRRENALNKSRQKNARCPHIGVRKSSVNNWRAYIRVEGRLIHLGTFARIEDAIAARKGAEVAHGFHPNHGRPSRVPKGVT